MANIPKIIAFYLPQYHPTPNNDKWWGTGFTEWTNVGKAKPLFPGHYQPKIPADLGYYDLRIPEVREAQVKLAKEAGIYGFCYYHYWFGNGEMELDRPFQEVLKSGKPDFPFMLCWANESWHKKFWNKDGKGSSKEILVEQLYPGEKDIEDHFYHLLPAFRDSRYIRIDGKIAFMIYCPEQMSDIELFINKWQILAKKNDLPQFFFIAQIRSLLDFRKSCHDYLGELQEKGIDALNVVRLNDAATHYNNHSLLHRIKSKILRNIFHYPTRVDYRKIISELIKSDEREERIYPTIIPNWDHTPRSGKNGCVYENTTPQVFGKHVVDALNAVNHKREEHQVIFLKSWNEWGEGNYMEPDLRYGKGFITELSEQLKKKR